MGTLVKSTLDTHQSSIATPLTLPASSPNSRKRSIVVPVRSWKTTPSSSSPVTPLSLSSPHRSQCASNPSRNTHLLDVSPSVTWDRPSPSVSSSPSTRRKSLERPPSPPLRPVRSDWLHHQPPRALQIASTVATTNQIEVSSYSVVMWSTLPQSLPVTYS